MASVKVSFGAFHNIGGTAVYTKAPRIAETLTSSGVSQQTANAATPGEFVTITSTGGAVHVMAGANPTASPTAGYIVSDGDTKNLGPLAAGDEVAILDV
jgi:hypothetical protein